MSKVFIYPVSDKESAEDLNELENNKNVYWEAKKKPVSSLKKGDIFLIYVSENLREIKYICEVTNVDDGGKEFSLNLLNIIDNDVSYLLSREFLKKYGNLKGEFYSYRILNNNPQLCSYISNVLLEHGYIDKDLCDENKDFIDEKKKMI